MAESDKGPFVCPFCEDQDFKPHLKFASEADVKINHVQPFCVPMSYGRVVRHTAIKER